MSENFDRDKLIDEAHRLPLAELAAQVLYGSYTPGVHDVVLVERCEMIDLAFARAKELATAKAVEFVDEDIGDDPVMIMGKCKGTEEFAALVDQLIDAGHNYLYPEVSRTRHTDWMAHILSHPDERQRKIIASGQAATMHEACQACVINYHDRQAAEVRKNELLKDQNVVEAMKLFGFSAAGKMD